MTADPPPPPQQVQGSERLKRKSFAAGIEQDGRSYFWMGGSTPRVPFEMQRQHREKLVQQLREQLGEAGSRGCVVFFEGGTETSVYDTDTHWDFKQESNFQWLFGVREPGCLGAVDVASGKAMLFVPRLAEMYEAWMGERRSLNWFKSTYEVDGAFYTDEVAGVLKSELSAKSVLIYHGTNRDSGLSLREPCFEGMKEFEVVKEVMLWDTLAECRAIKDEEEVKVLEYVNDVSSDAHVAVMRGVRPNTPEYISEANFRHFSFLRGCARMGYNCIAPSGKRAAVLHYGHSAFPNAEDVLPGEMKLHDMGAEYHCYTADVTVSFPVDGKFTAPQRAVYEAVWAATLAVEQAVRPGIAYTDMHQLAQRTLLEQMTTAGLFKGDVQDMMAAKLMAHFMPHGLGHQLGLDVHDTGGYAPGENRKTHYPHIEENLRCGRKLMENMVLTVEPGFYFIDYLIRNALAEPAKARFINAEKLAEFRPVGGIRIEDNIVITKGGCRILTRTPRTVQEIEAVMAGGKWEAREQPFREYTASKI